MSIEPVIRFRRTVRVAYSRHPLARLYRGWLRLVDDPDARGEGCAADILMLPLVGLAATAWVLAAVPGASEAIAAACSTACLP